MSLRLYRQHFVPFLVLAVVLETPAYVLIAASGFGVGRPPPSLIPGSVEDALCGAVLTAVPGLLGGVLSGLFYIGLTGAIALGVVKTGLNEPLKVLGLLSETKQSLWPLTAGALLAVVIVLLLIGLPLASLAFINGCYGGESAEMAANLRRAIEGLGRLQLAQGLAFGGLALGLGYVINVAVKWIVMPQVAVFEGGTASSVLWRSRDLVRGRWWEVALTLFDLLLVQAVLGFFLGLPFTVASAWFGAPAAWLGIVGPTLAQIAVLPIGAIGSTLVYLRLRVLRDAEIERELALEEWAAS